MTTEDIRRRHEELVKHCASGWSDVRNDQKFTLKPVKYSFGVRNTYVPNDVSYNFDLQDSRSNGITSEQTYEDYVSSIEQRSSVLEESDLIRIRELDKIFELLDNSFGLQVGRESLAEIGFRNPRLLRHYKETYERVKGYDISRINVDVGRMMGYDCEVWDLNNETHVTSEEHDVLLCYHVLEHTHDPPQALERIRRALKPGGLLHIEIPIEPGTPRLRFAHLIALEAGDLKAMLDGGGFEVVTFSTQTHSGGTHIERVSAIRK